MDNEEFLDYFFLQRMLTFGQWVCKRVLSPITHLVSYLGSSPEEGSWPKVSSFSALFILRLVLSLVRLESLSVPPLPFLRPEIKPSISEKKSHFFQNLDLLPCSEFFWITTTTHRGDTRRGEVRRGEIKVGKLEYDGGD